MIRENKKNVIINLPTGTGKNLVIIYSMKDKLKYLILVPRIILMYQLKEEIIKHKPKMKSKIQLIGDSNNHFDEKKLITICVFNSVHLIEDFCSTFEKIFIDEAHHINKPAIYYENEEYDFDEDFIDKDGNKEEDETCDSLEYFSDNDSIDTKDISEDIDSSDDTEDELVNVKNYTKIIKSLDKYENNVYLSATIDACDNFEYYSQDIRTMIDLKYLCDYQIHVPIFNDDISNKNICEHLLKNYRSIIIYCNSQKEGKQINKLMNELQLNSSDYIDCNTSKKKRDIIIEKYKRGEIAFLVNVRILVEGFDAPITKGVCFLHLPTSKTTLIQIIGRCLRLHPNKTIANVILPFSAKEDEKNICNFLKVMAKNDSRIKKSFENKQLGGYISIENTNEDEENDNENEDIDIEFKYNMIYNSMGILQNGEEIWMKRLEEVKLYIDKNGKRPSKHNKDVKIRKLGIWIGHQIQNYKKNEHIMKKYWEDFIEKYKEYFLSNEELWFNSLKQVEEYIIKNGKRPSKSDEDVEIKKLGQWISTQQKNYNKYGNIMKDKIIKTNWEDFIEKYKQYFLSNSELWFNRLKQVEEYIIKNSKRPSEHNNDWEIKKLAKWIGIQIQNYNKNENIMKDTIIKTYWKDFIEKYKQYFISNEELWFNRLKQVEEYIIKNGKTPSKSDEDVEIKKLGQWIGRQKTNYNKNEKIMKDTIIKTHWEDFIEKYKEYFISNEESWFNNLKQVEEYIIKNNKKPSYSDEDLEIKKLANWIGIQIQNYNKNENIMKDTIIKTHWEDFIEKYKEYFLSNEESWFNNLKQVEEYIIKNNKKPSYSDEDVEIKKFGKWIGRQQTNYSKNENIMKDKFIKTHWEDFIEKYKEYFLSNEELWFNRLKQVEEYIIKNGKRPSDSNKDIKIKKLGQWIGRQQTNYNKNKKNMKDTIIKTHWENFIEIYKKYF
jgi:superfamily II DNA or RNA helicase/dephospho-CoA kinase